MRGGLRLPALIVAAGLLAGCSDPAGAARREQAAAPKKSPSPRATASPTPTTEAHAKTARWWQAAGTTRTIAGLRVRTGALRAGLVKVIVTDVAGHASRRITASAAPQTISVGGFTLTAVKVARSKTGRYGVGFRYRR